MRVRPQSLHLRRRSCCISGFRANPHQNASMVAQHASRPGYCDFGEIFVARTIGADIAEK